MKNYYPLIFLLIVSVVVSSGCSEISETAVTLEVPEVPVQYRKFNDEFKQAVMLLSKVRELSNPPGSENQIAFQLSKETEEKIIENSREGIRLGKLVSDEYLDSIFPELWLHDCVALNETSPQGYSPL